MQLNTKALVLSASLALAACDKAPAPAVKMEPEQAHQRLVTLKCNIEVTDNDAGTQAAAPTTTMSRTDYYRIDTVSRKIAVWDDSEARFEDICSGMKCDTHVSDKEFFWKKEMPKTKDTSLIVLYIDQARINRATGNLMGNAEFSVHKNFVPLRDSSTLYSGKCESSDFDGNKKKF